MRTTIPGICALFVLGTLIGCSERASEDTSEAVVTEDVVVEETVVPAGPTVEERLRVALVDPSRPERDTERDAGRKPDQVVTFLGIDSGMTVLDLFAAGGYYTEVLAAAVGPTGKVYAHNNNFLLTVLDGAFARTMEARLADNRLPNVERLDAEVDEMGLAPGSLDAIMFVQNYHDVYSFTQESGGTTEGVLRILYEALKPGGMLVIIDHSANPGPHDPELHRIDESIVKSEVPAAGFVLERESGVLRNRDDDRTLGVFDPAIRGQTDRYVLLYRKPMDAG